MITNTYLHLYIIFYERGWMVGMNAATLSLNPALDRIMYFQSFEKGRLNRTSAPSMLVAGSKGINIARTLARLGVKNTAFGFSGGRNGEILESCLEREGLVYQSVRTRAETRMNIKIVTPDQKGTEANEGGGPIHSDELDRLIELLVAEFDSIDSLFLSGSVPDGVGKELYRVLIEKAKRRGVATFLDCDGDALVQGVLAGPDIIKPNLYELGLFCDQTGRSYDFSTPLSIARLCHSIYESYGCGVLLTLGADGSLYTGIEGCFSVNAPKVAVKNFSGAGDVFLAVFSAAYDRCGQVPYALRAAAAGAAAKLACADMPDRERLMERIEECEVQEIHP